MRRLLQSGPPLAVLLSILLHGVVLVPVVGLLGADGGVPPPADSGSVELLPVEVLGADAVRPDNAAEAEQPVQPSRRSDAPEVTEERERAETDQPPPEPSPGLPTEPATRPAALTLRIAGTDSPSSAIAAGDRLIPASPDDAARNRPPVYPREAVLRRDEGTVIVLIQVSSLGLAEGARVLTSSGHHSLDQAAVDAVLTWRFRPAVRDGRAIPFEMPMRIVFAMR